METFQKYRGTVGAVLGALVAAAGVLGVQVTVPSTCPADEPPAVQAQAVP